MTLPNAITVFRMALVPAVAASYVYGHRSWAFWLFLIAGFSDMLDGFIARKTNTITDFGKIMDPFADKMLVAAALICFYAVDRAIPLWLLIVVLGKETVMVLGGVFLYKRRDFVVSSRVYGKVAALLFSAGIALTFWHERTSPYYLYALYAALALSLLSMILYAKDNLFSRLRRVDPR